MAAPVGISRTDFYTNPPRTLQRRTVLRLRRFAFPPFISSMNAERQQLSLALALSAAVNLLLAFIIVWAMAVSQGLGRSPAFAFPEPHAPAPPDEITILMSSAPPEEKPRKKFISSPDAAPDFAPTDAATRFISSQNLRAASEAEVQPDGLKGLPSQEGIDKPFLDLANTEYREGSEEAPSPPGPTPRDPSPAAEGPPPPTEPAPSEKSSNTPPEAPSPPDKLPDKPPDPADPRETPPSPDNKASVPPETIAFRDQNSPQLLPDPFLSANSPRPASLPPPLTRIPDRVPNPSARTGLRKARTVGSISNKGRSSVDAVATAEGRFGKILRSAVEKTWRRRLLTLSGLANPGLVEVEFEVDAKGRITNVKLANPGEANPVMQDCALSAIIEAKLPPPPAELFEELRENITGTRMRLSFSFLIY